MDTSRSLSDTPERSGTSFVVPAGAGFQLRNLGPDPIDFIGVTMPPWPGIKPP